MFATSDSKGFRSKPKIDRYWIYHVDIFIFHISQVKIEKQTILLVFIFDEKYKWLAKTDLDFLIKTGMEKRDSGLFFKNRVALSGYAI